MKKIVDKNSVAAEKAEKKCGTKACHTDKHVHKEEKKDKPEKAGKACCKAKSGK